MLPIQNSYSTIIFNFNIRHGFRFVLKVLPLKLSTLNLHSSKTVVLLYIQKKGLQVFFFRIFENLSMIIETMNK